MKKQPKNNYFFEMPQERDIKGTIEYIKNGQKKKALLVYSIPCERCNGCPMYRIDKTIEPTSYYCQGRLLQAQYKIAKEKKQIPENCKEWERYIFKNTL